MPIAYYGAQISPHMVRTPEGYLICKDVPINRTGDQMYQARDLMLDGDPEALITVHRYPEDVFDAAALASFEGKDVTAGHPPDNLTPETQAAYSKGHVQNVRRVGDTTVADLYIKDASLISDIQSGAVREVSCGYLCSYEPDGDGYKQTTIRGNHVAVVPRGRAGHDIAIHDAAASEAVEKGRSQAMTKFTQAILKLFGQSTKDASPEEIDEMAAVTATVLDAAPAEQAQEAEPAAEEKAADEMIERAPKGDDLGSKLDRVLEMLTTLHHEEEREEKHEEEHMSDEGDIDKVIAKLAGEDPEAAVTVPAEEMEDSCPAHVGDTATLELLRKVRPAVAQITDKAARARVVDALLSTIKGDMGGIMQAVQDSAKANQAAKQTSYEQACADAQAAYNARNPHKSKEA